MKKTVIVIAALAVATSMHAQSENDTTKVDSAAYWKQFELKEVNVTAERKLVKQDIDKMSYDMAGDEEAKAKNTLEMLRKVPMVTVDGQDNIRVKGSSSFKIYRNGHPDPSLEGSNVSQILKAMPANTIKKIEVITQPGAKYDAEGTSTILNIVMKDNVGMAGVAGTLSYAMNQRGDLQTGANVTTQTGKLTLSVNYGFIKTTKKATESDEHSEQNFLDSGERLVTDQHYDGPLKLHYGNISASYDIDSLNLITLSGGGFYVQPDIQGYNTTKRYNADGTVNYSYDGLFTVPKYKQYSFNGRIDYQHKTHLDGEVLTLSYMGVTTRNDQNSNNAFYNIVSAPFSYTGYEQRQKEKFFEHTGQIDYVRPLGKVLKMEIGAKYINRSNKSNTTMDYDGFDAGDIYSKFNHNTQIAAAYAEWLASVGKWSFRAGLRYEYSHMKVTYPDGSESGFSKNLNDWCPSASMQYKFNDANTLSLNYATTINRPGIEYLNPARVETPTSISEGAPGLNSTRNQKIELTYMHISSKFTFNISPAFYFSNNQITALQGEREGKTWTSYGNVNRERSFYTTAFAQITPWKGGNLSINLGGGYHWYKNPNISLDLGGWNGNYDFDFSQRLPWKLNFMVGAGGNFGNEPSSVYNYQTHWDYHYLGIQRSFLKEDRLTVMLAANNPFEHHNVFNTRTVQGDYTGFNRNIRSNQQFGIRISYRFGSLKAQVKTADRSIDNDDVIGGIKQQGAGNQGGGR